MSTLSASTAKEIRGRIMHILKLNYPYEAGDSLINTILLDMQYLTSPAVLSGYLTYLEEKGYIETRQVAACGIEQRLAKLTPKGIDLIEGNIGTDPGVLIRD